MFFISFWSSARREHIKLVIVRVCEYLFVTSLYYASRTVYQTFWRSNQLDCNSGHIKWAIGLGRCFDEVNNLLAGSVFVRKANSSIKQLFQIAKALPTG